MSNVFEKITVIPDLPEGAMFAMRNPDGSGLIYMNDGSWKRWTAEQWQESVSKAYTIMMERIRALEGEEL